MGFHDGIVGSERFEFIFGGNEGQLGEFGNVLGYIFSIAFGCVDTGAYGGATEGEFA